MPYDSVADVPDSVPQEKRAQWREVWNGAHAAALKDGKGAEAAEASAFAQANAVAGPNAKVAVDAGLEKEPEKAAKYSPEQERDESGRWTSGGAGPPSDRMNRADFAITAEEHSGAADYHDEQAGKANTEERYGDASAHINASALHRQAASAVGHAAGLFDEGRHDPRGDSRAAREATARARDAEEAFTAENYPSTFGLFGGGKVAKYSDDQERDDRGRFAAGGAAEIAGTAKQHAAALQYHQGRSQEYPEGSTQRQAHEAAAAAHADASEGTRARRGRWSYRAQQESRWAHLVERKQAEEDALRAEAGDVKTKVAKYSEDQARDAGGRWTQGGGETATLTGEHQAAGLYHRDRARALRSAGDAVAAAHHEHAAHAHAQAAMSSGRAFTHADERLSELARIRSHEANSTTRGTSPSGVRWRQVPALGDKVAKIGASETALVGYVAQTDGPDRCDECLSYGAGYCSNVEVGLDPEVPEDQGGNKIVNADGWCAQFQEAAMAEAAKVFRKFVPLAKVDEAKREVGGYVTAEVLDKDGEVCHYDTTKPYYQAWSGEIEKASKGKSKGNLREMHQLSAVGAGKTLAFDDAAKSIYMTFKVVDEQAWQKVQEGVYTGFSQGGRYVKRWPGNDGRSYYTAQPMEVSLVDNPALGPTASFDFIRAADGQTEVRKFKGASAEPPPDAYVLTKEQAASLADHVGKLYGIDPAAVDITKPFMVKAAARTRRVGAEDLTADKFAYVGDPEKTDTWKLPVHDAAHVRDALSRFSQTEGIPADKKAEVRARVKAAAEGHGITAEADKVALKVFLREKISAGEMGKCLADVGQLAAILDQLAAIRDHEAFERLQEGDQSTLPEALNSNIAALSATLMQWVEEETRELTAVKAAKGGVSMGDTRKNHDSLKAAHGAFAKALEQFVKEIGDFTIGERDEVKPIDPEKGATEDIQTEAESAKAARAAEAKAAIPAGVSKEEVQRMIDATVGKAVETSVEATLEKLFGEPEGEEDPEDKKAKDAAAEAAEAEAGKASRGVGSRSAVTEKPKAVIRTVRVEKGDDAGKVAEKDSGPADVNKALTGDPVEGMKLMRGVKATPLPPHLEGAIGARSGKNG